MKKFSFAMLSILFLVAAGCSRSDKPETAAPPKSSSTPDAARLKADSERLREATANAAREREKAASQPAASPTAPP